VVLVVVLPNLPVAVREPLAKGMQVELDQLTPPVVVVVVPLRWVKTVLPQTVGMEGMV
tara:strand:+ start:195 stop:368 length:174 start_codon:yes stop_codon:yes gene_type:complete